MKNIFKDLFLEELTINEDSIFPKILEIRNEDLVRNNMFNNKIIPLNEHLQWIKDHLKNRTKRIFKVNFEKKLIGTLILNTPSKLEKEIEWAFYLTKLSKTGTGAIVEYKFLDFFFEEYPNNLLKCEVLAFNKSVISLHKKFGFQVVELKKNRLLRNNVSIDSVVMRLNKNDWHTNKKEIKKKLKM